MSSFIQRLYTTDKAQWIWEFFPEYAELFGGYPSPIPRTYGQIKGTSPCIERHPWYGWQSGLNIIQASGIRAVPISQEDYGKPKVGPFGQSKIRYEEVPENEYRAWCDSCNYYRNGGHTPYGGLGLDPKWVLEGVDDRLSQAYWDRQERYKRENLPVKPDFITCPEGIYLPMRGVSRKNPWGVNSAFIRYGEHKPIYVSDRYGPDRYDTPPYIPLPKDAEGNIEIPTQEAYDEIRWSQWL